MKDFINLTKLKLPALKAGSHSNPEDGLCALEMIAFIEREKHSDRPECVCPVIAAFVRLTNDWFNDEERQLLLPILHTLVGTVSKEHELDRAEYLANFASEVFVPLAYQTAEFAKSSESAAQSVKLAAQSAKFAAQSVKLAAQSAKFAAKSAVAAAMSAQSAKYGGEIREALVAQSLIAIEGVSAIGRPKIKGFTTSERLKELEALAV